MTMASKEPIFVYIANYDKVEDAKADYQAVKDLHRAGVIGTYDAALVTRDANGRVHIHETEKPTEHGAEAGLATGAVAGGVAAAVSGVFFPPIALAGAAVGALGGAAIGHLRRGLPRKDLDEIGDALRDSEASVVVVGQSTLDKAVKAALKSASRQLEREIDDDADELKRLIEAANR